ncbi:hypothetical protein CO666_15035 [Rhizobium chutanense]|uniref:Uncharacterized protein n=1 Tax=Rhizobium chutanense TaxID=2035448 RepID=A0A2A6JBL4_9HYPH|nr:hypothetical protein [Rhizobium chutanense]PDT03362.1 hypothetical protein CO666_15035 [Rhizobium chutanense]
METSRHTSFAIFAFTILAFGALLLEHTGFLAFRTEILAGVDDGDVVGATDFLSKTPSAAPSR